MKCSYACNSPDTFCRGGGSWAAAAGAQAWAQGFAGFTRPAIAAELARKQRQVLVIWLAGGASQLETWDPKPKTDTGGPFRSIETSVPGVRISELLPRTAMQMHRLALLRSINTNENDHGKGTYLMHTGRPQTPALVVSPPGLGDGPVADRRRATPCPATSTSRPAAAARGRARRPSSGPSTTRSTWATARPRPTPRRTPPSRRSGPRAGRPCGCTPTTGSPAAAGPPRPRPTPPPTSRPRS